MFVCLGLIKDGSFQIFPRPFNRYKKGNLDWCGHIESMLVYTDKHVSLGGSLRGSRRLLRVILTPGTLTYRVYPCHTRRFDWSLAGVGGGDLRVISVTSTSPHFSIGCRCKRCVYYGPR